MYINVKIMLICCTNNAITWYCIGIWSIYVFTSMFFVPLARILWWRTFVKGSLVCYTNLCFGVLYMINVYLSFFQNICLAGRGCCTWCKPKAYTTCVCSIWDILRFIELAPLCQIDAIYVIKGSSIKMGKFVWV